MSRPTIIKTVILSVAGLCGVFLWANIPHKTIQAGVFADRIEVWKSKRRLVLYSNGKTLKMYHVSLGKNPVGPKQIEGDARTPEGLYTIEYHNPTSSCHKALKVSYPSEADQKAVEQKGASPGGDIMIHGIKNGYGLLGRLHRWVDWTSGCIAVTDSEMDEIYDVVPDGTPINIHP